LAVCPWNKFAKESKEIKFKQKNQNELYDLKKLSLLDDDSFRKMFSKSPIKRIGRNRFLRNVLIAIGNAKLKDAKDHINKNIFDESPIVRGSSYLGLKSNYRWRGIKRN
jgi:epoxyqueuosine reductase